MAGIQQQIDSLIKEKTDSFLVYVSICAMASDDPNKSVFFDSYCDFLNSIDNKIEELEKKLKLLH